MDEIAISVRSSPNLELWHHHRIVKTLIRHNDVICSYIENTYTTLWRHTNLCCLFLGFTWRHNFTGGQLQINAQSSEGNSFSLYVWDFVRFFHSSTAKSSIHFGLTPLRLTAKYPSETQEYQMQNTNGLCCLCQNLKSNWLLQGKVSQIQINNKKIIEFGSRRI